MDFEKPDWKKEAERRGESLPDWYTLQDVARILDYSDGSYLARLARTSKIVTYKVGTVRFVDSKQIQILMNKK